MRAIKDEIHIKKQGKRKGKKRGRIKKQRKKKKKTVAATTSARAGSGETEAGEDGDESEQDDSSSGGGWRPQNRAPHKPIRPPIRCYDNFRMSVQASRSHCCIPRDDHGPYSAVEVGYPSQLEELLMPYADGAGAAGMRPTLYVRVPAAVIQAVVEVHGGIASGHLPPLTTNTTPPRTAAAAAFVTPPERDENGCKWAAPCQPPSTTPSDSGSETEREVDETRRSPSSAVHLGAIPPPPPLIEMVMSPIERVQEDF